MRQSRKSLEASTVDTMPKGLEKTLSPLQGDRWAIILPNCVEYIEVTHAVLWTSGVSCPINHALKAGEIAHALMVSRPRFVVAYGPILSKLSEALQLVQDILLVDFWDEKEILEDLIAILDRTARDTAGFRFAFLFRERPEG